MSVKIGLVIMFLLCNVRVYSQSSFSLGAKLDIEASFISNDSLLVLKYKNNDSFSKLIWVGDFSVSVIFNQNDISTSFLASPIVNEIFLVKRKLKTKKNASAFFLRNDSTELNLYNYKVLGSKDELKVTLKVGNDSLVKLIVNKQFSVNGAVSVIDLDNLTDFISIESKSYKNWKTVIDIYTQKQNYSNTLTPILLKNIPWEFNRKTETMEVNGLNWGPIQRGGFSKNKLIFQEDLTKDKLQFFSFEYLYRFADKQYFVCDIKLE